MKLENLIPGTFYWTDEHRCSCFQILNFDYVSDSTGSDFTTLVYIQNYQLVNRHFNPSIFGKKEAQIVWSKSYLDMISQGAINGEVYKFDLPMTQEEIVELLLEL